MHRDISLYLMYLKRTMWASHGTFVRKIRFKIRFTHLHEFFEIGFKQKEQIELALRKESLNDLFPVVFSFKWEDKTYSNSWYISNTFDFMYHFSNFYSFRISNASVISIRNGSCVVIREILWAGKKFSTQKEVTVLCLNEKEGSCAIFLVLNVICCPASSINFFISTVLGFDHHYNF